MIFLIKEKALLALNHFVDEKNSVLEFERKSAGFAGRSFSQNQILWALSTEKIQIERRFLWLFEKKHKMDSLFNKV